MRIVLGTSKHRLEFFDGWPVLEGNIEFGSVVGNTEFGVFYLEENFEIVSTLYTKCSSPRGFLAFLDFGLSRGEVSDFLKIWSLVEGNFGFDLC